MDFQKVTVDLRRLDYFEVCGSARYGRCDPIATSGIHLRIHAEIRNGIIRQTNRSPLLPTANTTSTMAAVQNPRRTDWADEEPELASTVPPPQVTRNKDGTETITTIFINDDGKRVKRTQRIRRTVVKKKENPRVAERRLWPKIGPEAGNPPGPRGDTTTLGENIVFRPMVGFKSGQVQEKAPEDDRKAETLKKMQIKCRICQGDHFTLKCPFKDTMAPEGEAAGAPADADGGSAGAAEGGLGAGGSSYVPPHLRKGGAAATGERMGGKYERDDLATLRVTNVGVTPLRYSPPLSNHHARRSPSLPKKTSYAPCSSATAASPVSSWPKTAKPDGQKALRLCRLLIARTRRGRARRWMAWATDI